MKPIKLIIILSLFLTSCDFTDKLWRDNYYQETIKNFMISPDGHKIVFLGKKYHYIFDDKNSELKDLLLWEGRNLLEISNFHIEVTAFNKMKGNILISVSKNHSKSMPEDYIKFLKKSEFRVREYKHLDEISAKKQIYFSGTRYLPKPNTNYDINSSLNQEYRVTIRYNDLYDQSKKIALTPVAVAADATGFVLGVTAMVLFIPFIVGCSAVSKDCLKIH